MYIGILKLEALLLDSRKYLGAQILAQLLRMLNTRVHYWQPGNERSQVSKGWVVVVVNLQVFRLLLLLDRLAGPRVVHTLLVRAFKLVLDS